MRGSASTLIKFFQIVPDSNDDFAPPPAGPFVTPLVLGKAKTRGKLGFAVNQGLAENLWERTYSAGIGLNP